MTDFTENSVVTDAKHSSPGTNSDSGEEFEIDEEARKDAYENMYAQWLRVCDENRALVSENVFLIDLKDKFAKKV